MTDAEAERLKIAEFGMTLEAPAARWHAKHLSGSIALFDELKREIVSQFYTTRQDQLETMLQFIIRF